MKIYVVRHGQTDANINNVIQGWLNVPLNEVGHGQAHKAAEGFHHEVDAIFHSDLKRAVDTAEYFKKRYTDTPCFVDWRLRERCFGEGQGTKKERRDWEVFWSKEHKLVYEGAEPLNAFTDRIVSFLESIKSLYTDLDAVLIVTHGGVINRMLTLSGAEEGYQQIDNATVLEFDI